MKKFISILNIILFLFISYIIFKEILWSDGSIFPSVLYERAEKLGSVYKYYIEPLWNLIFTYIATVSLSILTIIILLFFRKVKKFFYILSTVCNLIISIPIFNMYNNLFCFLDNTLDYIISPWAAYIFFSAFSAVLLFMYILFDRIKHFFKKTTIYKVKKGLLIFAIIFFILYCINSVYLSIKIKNIADESYATYGKINRFQNDISDLNFLRMRIRGNLDKNKITYEKRWCSFPITFVFFNKARAWYWYEYKSNLSSARTDLYFPVVVDLELKKLRWVVVNVFDHP